LDEIIQNILVTIFCKNFYEFVVFQLRTIRPKAMDFAVTRKVLLNLAILT